MTRPRRSWPHALAVFGLGALLTPVGSAMGSLLISLASAVATFNTRDFPDVPRLFVIGTIMGLTFAWPVTVLAIPIAHLLGAGPSALLAWASGVGFLSPMLVLATWTDGVAFLALFIGPVGAAAGAVCAWLFECAVASAAP